MAIVIMKSPHFTQIPGYWRQLLDGWFSSQSCLQNHWQKFKTVSGNSHQVPYRVWSRHGAYLEINRGGHGIN